MKQEEKPKLKLNLTIPDKLESIKSTKRILMKTIASKESNPRLLRSGKTLGKLKFEKSSNTPRTRSHKKDKSGSKSKDKSGSKRKIISKLIESK